MIAGTQEGILEYKKQQDYLYTNPGASIGYGKRSDPNQFLAHWTPAPGTYTVAKDGVQNESPQFKFGTGNRDERKVPDYPGPANKYEIKSQFQGGHGDGPQFTMGSKKGYDKKDQDVPGPGTYMMKGHQTAPNFSMGSRFDSDVRSKDHIKPRKKDGPGPGSYEIPSALKDVKAQTQKATFGKARREWSDLPKHTPAPNNYNPAKFTEATHQYSFPKAPKIGDQQLYKSSFTPGPGAYEIRKEEYKDGYAKSFLGGPLEDKQNLDNGVPGPGQYNPKGLGSVPGFKIVPHQEKSITRGDSQDDGQNAPVGPQKYDPNYPAHTTLGAKFGTGTRDDLKQKFYTPAPNNYTLKSDFEKNPKFHMGMRTNGGRTNKNLDMPGPGEYETDVIPMHHTNIQHVIGTGFRSDLGVGKAHLYPGPGEYQTRGEITQEGPNIGFGTQMKITRIKKTFEPGPGSYDLPTTVGHIPKYLLLASGEAQTKTQQRSRIEEQ